MQNSLRSQYQLPKNGQRRCGWPKLYFAAYLMAIAQIFSLHKAYCQTQKLESAAIQKEHELEVRAQMMDISRQLKVDCAHCHNLANFKVDEKAPFIIAKKHMELTQLLIEHGLDGSRPDRPKATCYMCHRGKAKPDYLESVVAKGSETAIPSKGKENSAKKDDKSEGTETNSGNSKKKSNEAGY